MAAQRDNEFGFMSLFMLQAQKEGRGMEEPPVNLSF